MHHLLFTYHACYFMSGDVTYFPQLDFLDANSFDTFTVFLAEQLRIVYFLFIHEIILDK